jgi:16S rRNA (adenine1518-N6/adenine1519-N6)-dimethyltransferase
LSAIDDLPPLRDVARVHGLLPKKSLGQNFLFDLNLTARIARAAGPLDGVTVVEIGPGPGGLTRSLLAEGATKVIAIERDERCLPALADVAARYPGRLDVIHGDALEVDPRALVEGGRKARICANLPYNVATPLLVQWLLTEPWPPWFDRMVLMFQREVAERIVATPDEREDYGRLGVLAGWRTRAKILFDIPPSAFFPPPKVTSSVVELLPRDTPATCSADVLSNITRAAFGQRRKMLRGSLKPLGGEALLRRADIEPERRAETLSVAEFDRLARLLD